MVEDGSCHRFPVSMCLCPVCVMWPQSVSYLHYRLHSCCLWTQTLVSSVITLRCRMWECSIHPQCCSTHYCLCGCVWLSMYVGSSERCAHVCFMSSALSPSLPRQDVRLAHVALQNTCALCPVPFALCPLPCAFCPVPFALCPLPFALCPLPCALCPVPFAMYIVFVHLCDEQCCVMYHAHTPG